MEDVGSFYNSNILNVLKHFQNASKQSLKGPNLLVNAMPQVLSTQEIEGYVKSLTLSASRDTEKGKLNSYSDTPLLLPQGASIIGDRCETLLEGETISGFSIGGEQRLCLPQILHTVLRPCLMEEVQNACDDLHIYLSRCNPTQLQILKRSEVLPGSAQNSGLITKTDAERLCSKLLHNEPEIAKHNPSSETSFKVYHECFGKCTGILSPELYVTSVSPCIECYDCCGMFSPQNFVSHSHSQSENNVCHWGFDSENWRSYLRVAKNQDSHEELLKHLTELKDKFAGENKSSKKEVSLAFLI